MARDKINSGQYIWLCEKDSSSGRRFKITGAMDYEGGSSVCYYACSEGENSKTGVLKEFYPAVYAHVLKREKNESSEAYNQLSASPEYDEEGCGNFKRDLAECVRIHSRLQSAKNENRQFDNFIPDYEILYGCTEDGDIIGTVYIWEPGWDKLTLRDFYAGICKDPAENAPEKLKTLLNAMIALAAGVQALHEAGMVHQDINPGNIGFKRSSTGGILPETCCMFDMNTISFLDNAKNIGTNGYMAPELISNPRSTCTFRSDTYSLGCCIFSALAASSGVNGQETLYKSSTDNFNALSATVSNSGLIAAVLNELPLDAGQRLAGKITYILKKCLERMAGSRYSKMSDLISDLRSAISLLEVHAAGKEGWNVGLTDDGFWCRELFDEAPSTLARYYHDLYAAVCGGVISRTIFLTGEVLILFMRIPLTILFNGVHRICAISRDFSKLLQEDINFSRLFENSMKILTHSDWPGCLEAAADTDPEIFKKYINDSTQAAVYTNTIEYIKQLHAIFDSCLSDEANESSAANMMQWISKQLLQGCFALYSDGNSYRISAFLKLFCRAGKASLYYYSRISLADYRKRMLKGFREDVPETEVFICYENRYFFKIHPFLAGKEKNISCYAGYDRKKKQAYLLNYSSGKFWIEPGLSRYLASHSEMSDLSGNVLSGENVFDDDIETKYEDMLKTALFNEEDEVFAISALYEWICDTVSEQDKGLLLIKAESGMGKSTFSRTINQLTKSNITGLENDVNERFMQLGKTTAIRVYSFRDFRSEKNSCLRKIKDEILTLEAAVPEEGKAANKLTGTAEDLWDNLRVCPEAARSGYFTKAINYTYKNYRQRLRKQKLILVLDGIDEAANVKELLSFMPDPGKLNKNVYILLTCRTDNELENCPELLKFINHTDFASILSYGRKEAREALLAFSESIILEHESKITPGKAKKLAQLFNYKFSELSAYRKLCSMSEDFYINNASGLYDGSNNLFTVFMEYLKEKAAPAYINRVEDILNTLVYAGPLSLRELAFLSGEQYVSYSLIGILNDLRAFIKISRSESGNHYEISHAQWERTIRESCPMGGIQFRLRCTGLLDAVSDLRRSDRIWDILKPEYEGERWLLTHIFKIYVRDWNDINQNWFEPVRIRTVEKFYAAVLEKLRDADSFTVEGHIYSTAELAAALDVDGFSREYFEVLHSFDHSHFDGIRSIKSGAEPISTALMFLFERAMEKETDINRVLNYMECSAIIAAKSEGWKPFFHERDVYSRIMENPNPEVRALGAFFTGQRYYYSAFGLFDEALACFETSIEAFSETGASAYTKVYLCRALIYEADIYLRQRHLCKNPDIIPENLLKAGAIIEGFPEHAENADLLILNFQCSLYAGHFYYAVKDDIEKSIEQYKQALVSAKKIADIVPSYNNINNIPGTLVTLKNICTMKDDNKEELMMIDKEYELFHMKYPDFNYNGCQKAGKIMENPEQIWAAVYDCTASFNLNNLQKSNAANEVYRILKDFFRMESTGKIPAETLIKIRNCRNPEYFEKTNYTSVSEFHPDTVPLLRAVLQENDLL